MRSCNNSLCSISGTVWESNNLFSKWQQDLAWWTWCALAVLGFLELEVGKGERRWEVRGNKEKVRLVADFWSPNPHSFLVTKLLFEHLCLVKIFSACQWYYMGELEAGIQVDLWFNHLLARWYQAGYFISIRFPSADCLIILMPGLNKHELTLSRAQSRWSVNMRFVSLGC